MALVKCNECNGDVSTFADKCPHCGAPPSRVTPQPASTSGKKSDAISGFGTGAVIGLVILVVIFLASRLGGNETGPLSTGDTVIASMRAKQPQCRLNLLELERLGLKISDSGTATVAEYDEFLWGRLDHDDKIRQALLVYCAKMPPSGRYTVMIQGLHDGKTKASVVDGNYFDD